MACGIYQITNTVNGKSYIGQSRNIYQRWRQHTRGLDSPNALEMGSYPLRKAFLKYELNEIVGKPGKTGVFNFKIIEKCTENKLLERERFWINEIDPEYNCNLWTPARKKKGIVDTEPKFWVQYHNYDKLGYLPAESTLDESCEDEYEYDEVLPGISTNKRSVLNVVGDTVFLIVGIGDRPKQYYLWSTFLCEEVAVDEQEGSLSYDAFGSGHLIDPPQLLNSEEFHEFRKHCGNFGFGFMRIKPYGGKHQGSDYLNTLKKIAEDYKPKSEKVDFSQFIKNFYTEVTRVNPNEFSAYHKRGFARHLAVSLHIENALSLLMGEYTLLVTFKPYDHILHYGGSTLLIHSLDFYDLESGKEYLASYELDEETFPVNAIQGWVTVESIFKYDEKRFAADREIHQYEKDLSYYQDLCEGDVWGMTVKDPVILYSSVYVLPPEDISDGIFWEVEDLSQLEAFKTVLNNQIEEE
jgi:hypothetical protein